jgi:O-antigen/teichoic acid export membrane protein
MKATSIFGGVQVIQIAIQIIKTKVVAVLIGPTGMGIYGLLDSTVGLINGITSFGLGTSAVKSISASGANNSKKTAIVITVLRRLVWATGLLGALATLILAPWLSQLAFGNKTYSMAFIWLAVTLLLKQLTTGQFVILQGLRKLTYLASANLIGSLAGLIIAIPLYYFWGIEAIVPVFIITALFAFFISLFFSRKITLEKVKVSKLRTLAESKEMVFLGIMLSISTSYVLLKNYVLRAFISQIGGLAEVGLFTAGLAIINQYVGMVFTAMGTDYYPRLASLSKDFISMKKVVNQQLELALLIITPLILIFIVFITWIIPLLFSNEFNQINNMIQIAIMGTFFRIGSWAMAFIILVKGSNKMYLFNELIGGTVSFIFHLAGYYFGGLTGFGIGFLLGNIYYLLQVGWVVKRNFSFAVEKDAVYIAFINFTLMTLCFGLVFMFNNVWSLLFGSSITLVVVIYNLKQIDKRIDIKSLLKRIALKRTPNQK